MYSRLTVLSRLSAIPLLLLFLLAGCGAGDETSRILVVGLDGLDPVTVDLLMSEGKLPNFARLRQEGAYGRLLSQRPLLSPIVWTTIATGKTPDRHGIADFTTADEGSGERLPVTSGTRRVKALWNLFSQAGKRVAVVGWWATWPAEAVDGVIVSDRTAYHFLFEGGFGGDMDGKTYPPSLADEIAPLLVRPEDLTLDDVEGFVSVSEADLSRPFDFDDDLAHFKWALATARSYRDIGLELWRRERPELEMVYIEGTDSTAHLFGHLFRAEGLAGELAAQQARYGGAVERMYLFADELVGRYLAAMDDRTTLVVLSDHGFRLGELHDDPSQTRDLRRVSERFHREEGVLYMYGHRVRRHAGIQRASILDIAPTLLALAGVPPARDMPGRVLREALTLEAEPERVASYEGSGGELGESGGAARDAAAEKAMLEHLESLGYLSASGAGSDVADARSARGDRNLAGILFESGRYEEAVVLYRKMIEDDPEDGSLRASLAGALGTLGRYDEAKVELERALEIDPLGVEAYHNLGVVEERLGATEAAIEAYRTAVRYSPQYEPSQRALVRLTGTARLHQPRSEAERQAMSLGEEASQAARRSDYPQASALLDRAQALAPELAMLYQYRSNVAYLMGDKAAAIAALERGLELEPDNELFRFNLEQLKKDEGEREP